MKRYFALTLVAIFAFTMASVCLAEDSSAQGAGKSVTGFLKKTFNYPVKATQETGKMTANTLQNTGEKVIAKTGENTAAVLKGDVAKTGNLVGDNVVGASTTVGQTAAETVQAPVKAAEDDKPAEAAPAAK